MRPEESIRIREGTGDPSFSKEMGKKLASHVQHCRHLHFPGAGHIVMAEYPHAAIFAWIATVKAAQRSRPVLRDQA